MFISGLRLFGESYSGLEYDYKGLCNVYEFLNDTDKYLEYSQVLETWRMIREGNLEVNKNYLNFSMHNNFGNICSINQSALIRYLY